MKYLILLLFSLSSFSQGPDWQEVRLFARIKEINKGSPSLQYEGQETVPSVIQDKKLQDQLTKLKAGDEALIIGKIISSPKTVEGRTIFHQVFIIESIHPVSLEKLGKVELKEQDQPKKFSSFPTDYTPKSIPLSTDAASAITFTASVLLLNSLTNSGHDTTPKADLNKGVLFTAGALATGLFIYEQLKGKK
jgi:hypothetical protein